MNNLLSKSSPAYAMVYNNESGKWTAMGDEGGESSGQLPVDFMGAENPQKGSVAYLFMLKSGKWEAVSSEDLGGSSYISKMEEVPTSSINFTISGLGLDSSPVFYQACLIRPSASSPLVYASPRADSVSSDGFVVDFSAPVSEEGYLISYIVKG